MKDDLSERLRICGLFRGIRTPKKKILLHLLVRLYHSFFVLMAYQPL